MCGYYARAMASPGYETAIEKAKIKLVISEQLASLSRDARRDILADLLLACDEPATTGSASRPEVARPNGGISMPKRAIAKPPSTSKKQAIYEALKARPRQPIANVAELIYGDREATHKVRAILWQLKNDGRVNNPEPGQWEVIL